MAKIRISGDTSGYVELQAPDVAGSTVVTLPTESTSLVNATPLGAVIPFAGSSAPQGWLMCEGQTVSRTDYAGLFAVIGTTYGSGDGSTTFTLPNMKGRVPVGLDSTQTEFDALAETGGAKTHTLTTAEMPSHTHTQNSHNHTQNSHLHGITPSVNPYGIAGFGAGWGGVNMWPRSSDGSYQVGNNSGSTTATNNATTATNQNTGGGGAHNNLQPYITLNYIIKAA